MTDTGMYASLNVGSTIILTFHIVSGSIGESLNIFHYFSLNFRFFSFFMGVFTIVMTEYGMYEAYDCSNLSHVGIVDDKGELLSFQLIFTYF
jgi:hypothetical protein